MTRSLESLVPERLKTSTVSVSREWPLTGGGKRLSQRQAQIVELIANGVTSDIELSRAMHISINTLHREKSTLFKKMESHDITDTFSKAINLGVIKINPSRSI